MDELTGLVGQLVSEGCEPHEIVEILVEENGFEPNELLAVATSILQTRLQDVASAENPVEAFLDSKAEIDIYVDIVERM